MKIIRELQKKLERHIAPNKVIVIVGARRVGKTYLLNQLIKKLKEPYLFFNGEDFETHRLFEPQTAEYYRQFLGNHKLLIIDEAQKVPQIGNKLKLIVDSISDVKIIVTGSSAFDLNDTTGEPLTGRKTTYTLFPFSEKEFRQTDENITSRRDRLKQRLIFGNYPELIHLNDMRQKQEYLKEIINSYLLKDILVFENIKNASKIINLLRLIAFQVGSQVSLQELGKQLSMSKNTVERYLDLLSKVFIIFKMEGFSRNLRKEVTKSSKWYFYDNGIRNTIIANLNPLNLRNDSGMLWENYMIAERLKYQSQQSMLVNNYFWRTYDQQEIDLIEEREGKLFAYEFKWVKRNAKIPAAWKKNYPEAEFRVISSDDYYDWLVD
jgi:predicted AAA+ superfamily ATPase